ncbi:MAG: hypothetical protein ACYC5H_12180 [Methylovirgula sp.]
MTACSFTPAEIDEMTLFDVVSLFAYWRDYPPVHEILKCVYRIEKKPEPNIASLDDPSGIGALIARFPDGKVKPV